MHPVETTVTLIPADIYELRRLRERAEKEACGRIGSQEPVYTNGSREAQHALDSLDRILDQIK